MLLLSLERPLVEVANRMLVEPDKALDVVLLIIGLLVEDVSGKMAWMRISWHWAPIDSS